MSTPEVNHSLLPDPAPELTALSPEARNLLLGPWSGAAYDPDLSRDETLQERFEAAAHLHPQRPSVDEDGRICTYAELEARANRMARLLQAQGVGRGSFVGLRLPRGLEAYAALLGILKAGAAYVPLDPEFPGARVRTVAQDCGMVLLLSSSHLPLGAEMPCPVLNLEAIQEELAACSAEVLPPQSGVEDLAYVIYTSGSTGVPKGVPVSHRSVCTLVRAEARLFGPQPEDRVFQGFSLAFDASVEELWLALASGACLVAGTPRFLQSGPDLGLRLSEARVSIFSTVPTLLGMMEGALPTLRLLILGGEACPVELVKRWSRPGLRMVNTYGPTEATVISTWAELLPDRPVSIGRAVPNDRVYVLDAAGQLCAPGVAGELHLSGVGLSRGYLGRPELTAERFIPNPFMDGPTTERLYRTGDLVRFNPEGDLEFLGRIDAQVKLRGFRIELGEIEAALMAEPAVQLAAVALCKDEALERLVAYVVPRAGAGDGAEANEDALLRALRRRLPTYMVPSEVVFLPSLPTLASGKVDRPRLPAPMPRVKTPDLDAEPATAREGCLRACWARLFQGRQPGLDDDFFRDLGGHSLLADRKSVV